MSLLKGSNPSVIKQNIKDLQQKGHDQQTASKIALKSTSSGTDSGLISALNGLIVNVFHMYLSAHVAHWNVEGPLFPTLHEFFGEIYEDVHDSLDTFAEAIRQHDAFAPTSLTAEVPNLKGDAKALVSNLVSLNGVVMGDLKKTKQAAEAAGDEGLANFCQDRMAKHLKYDWQLKAQLKGK